LGQNYGFVVLSFHFHAASTDCVSKQVTLLLGIAEEDGSGRRYSFLGALFAGLSLVELSW